jgi:hypothetical protein
MANEPFVEVGWEVKGIRRADAFFDVLGEVLTLPVYLCFEGTSIATDVRALLESSAVEPGMDIPTGTLWPRPSMFHVLGDQAFLRKVAVLASQHAEAEICDHFHAYQNRHGLLQWYDAFNDPLLFDRSIPEATIQRFCSRLGARYSQPRAG